MSWDTVSSPRALFMLECRLNLRKALGCDAYTLTRFSDEVFYDKLISKCDGGLSSRGGFTL